MIELERFRSDLQRGETKELEEIYLTHKEAFIQWAKTSYRMREEQASDVFQDVIVIFYRQVAQGKLTRLDSQVKTYLFAIGKNLIRRTLAKEGRSISIEDMTIPDLPEESTLSSILHNEQQARMHRALAQLKQPCQKLLHLFYFQEMSLKDIQAVLPYKSPDVVKTQKARCMQYLRKIFTAQAI